MVNDVFQRLVDARTREDWVDAATICEKELGDFPQAINCWRQVIEKEPSRIDAHDALQRLCAMAGDWTMLAKVLQHRAKIVPPEQQRAVLTELLAICRDQLNDQHAVATIEAKLAELPA
jgi:hypothetical protein